MPSAQCSRIARLQLPAFNSKPLHPNAIGNRSGQKGSTTPTQFPAMFQFIHPPNPPLTRRAPKMQPFHFPLPRCHFQARPMPSCTIFSVHFKIATYTSGVAVQDCTAKHNAEQHRLDMRESTVFTLSLVDRPWGDSVEPGHFVPVPSSTSLNRDKKPDPEAETQLTLFPLYTSL